MKYQAMNDISDELLAGPRVDELIGEVLMRMTNKMLLDMKKEGRTPDWSTFQIVTGVDPLFPGSLGFKLCVEAK